MPELATVVGSDILPHVSALARLRRIVFRDWPYLYDGSDAYEAEYLSTYARCPRAALVIASDGAEAVGVSSCLPLSDETGNVQAPFRAAGLDPSRWFYFGESVLLRDYRGAGVGVAFFERREAHARSSGSYGHAAFCAVQRPHDHPMRPADAVPLDGFWRRRGFAPRPGLTCTMRWRDVGQAGGARGRDGPPHAVLDQGPRRERRMTLRLGVLQYPVTRIGSLADYAGKLDRLVAAGAAGGGQLLVMPEYACMEVAAAFGTEPNPAAERDAVCAASGEILRTMRGAARRHGIWLLPGTLPWRVGPRVVNRAPLIAPDGRLAFQDKQVMTRFEAEQWGVAAGAANRVFETPWGRVGIAICYDAEFPGVVRAQVEAGAWLVLVPTCTDTMHGFNRVRVSARARAIENQCFVAVSPTVGDAPWLAALDCNRGQAGVYGPADRGFPEDGVIAEGADASGWLWADLDPARLHAVREHGAVRNHRDWPPWSRAEPASVAEMQPWEDAR